MFQPFFQPVFIFNLQFFLPDQLQGQIHFLFRIHDLKIRGITQRSYRQDFPQKLQRHTVKGAEIPHIRQKRSFFGGRQPIPDLLCRFVREGKNHHIPVAYMRSFMKISYFHCQHRGFPASHIGIDKAGAAVIQHRLFLIFVEKRRHYKFTHGALLFPAFSEWFCVFPRLLFLPDVSPASGFREPGYNNGKYSKGCGNYFLP